MTYPLHRQVTKSGWSTNPRARSNNEQPLRKPAPSARLIRGLDRTKKVTASRAVPQPFFTPVRRRASGTKG
jgi:hypothetical protein